MTANGRHHLALVGPTASGKSGVAVAAARMLGDVEVVAVDSMSVYRGMDVATAKPTAAARAEVRHHCVDIADPDQPFSVAEFQVAARTAIAGIEARGRRALLVGGTGLYYQALVEGLAIPARSSPARAVLEARADDDLGALYAELANADPAAAGRIDPGNRRRIVRALEVIEVSGRRFSSFGPGLFGGGGALDTSAAAGGLDTSVAGGGLDVSAAGLWLSRSVTARRVEARVDAMLAGGLLDEAAALRARPAGLSRTAREAIGYREALAVLGGDLSVAQARQRIAARTRQLSRRQRMWFRRDRRITWIGTPGNPLAALPALLATWGRQP